MVNFDTEPRFKSQDNDNLIEPATKITSNLYPTPKYSNSQAVIRQMLGNRD